MPPEQNHSNNEVTVENKVYGRIGDIKNTKEIMMQKINKEIWNSNAGGLAFVVMLLFSIYAVFQYTTDNDPADSIINEFESLRFAINQAAPDGNYSQVTNGTLVKLRFVPAEIPVKGFTLLGPEVLWGQRGTFSVSGTKKFATIAFSPMSRDMCLVVVKKMFLWDPVEDDHWDSINNIDVSIAEEEESDATAFAEVACPNIDQNKIVVTIKKGDS